MTWRDDKERARLVEQVIAQHAEILLLRRTLADYAEHVDGDRAVGSYVLALQARIAQQDRNIAKLTQRKDAA